MRKNKVIKVKLRPRQVNFQNLVFSTQGNFRSLI